LCVTGLMENRCGLSSEWQQFFPDWNYQDIPGVNIPRKFHDQADWVDFKKIVAAIVKGYFGLRIDDQDAIWLSLLIRPS
jgi:hypothetical protein